MKTELLPCPFCGELPSGQLYPNDFEWTYQCVNGCTGTLYKSKWNTRPPKSQSKRTSANRQKVYKSNCMKEKNQC